MGKGVTKMELVDVRRMVLEERYVENPLTTDGLVHAALEEGEEQPRWTPAYVNLVTTIGGLARIKGLSDEQKAAAGRYRMLCEVAQIGGAQATDYAAVRVDGGGGGRDVVEIGASARRDYALARRALGPFAASLFERVVCEELTVREMARVMGEGNGGSGMRRTKRRLLEATDVLVRHFSRGGRGLRRSGERPGDWSLPAGGGDDATDD